MNSLISCNSDDTTETVYSKDGSELQHGFCAANEINDYFSNLTVDLDKNFKDSPANYPTTTFQTKLDLTESIEIRELISEIRKVDSSKSSGIIDISTKILMLNT